MTVELFILGTRGSPARYGGFETLADQLCRRIANHTFEVQVLASQSTTSFRRSLSNSKYLETAVGTLRTAKNLNVHGRHAVLVVNPVNIFAGSRLSRRGFLVVLHMDGRDDLRRKWVLPIRVLYRFFQRLCVWSGIQLIFDSVTVRSEIGGRHAEKYAVIAYGGCEACEKSRMVWQASNISRNFLTLARAEPENQLVQIVRAASAMREPAHLRVVTTTRYKGRYWASLVAEVEKSASSELNDGIWDKELLCSMYREVSAVIHGHTVGGTNPSLVLALCHGTPVFAHDNPYNREVAGSLARYWKNEEELTKLLDEFDPANWPYDQSMVDDFNRRYNWNDVVEKYRVVLGLKGPTETSTTN
jgi:glycosyltransferase involved in cell wall biosynthesis